MAKYSYYAVKSGRKIGVYTTWEDCRAQVDKFNGAEFKGFNNKTEAEEYINGEVSVKQSINYDGYDIVIYTDGSFNEKLNKYGGAFLPIKDNKELKYETVSGNDTEAVKERNSAGELIAVMSAVKWAVQNNYKKILIVHDYVGVASFINGSWKTKAECSKKYSEWMKKMINKYELAIQFEWVKGHKDDPFNNKVDKYAKEAVGI